MAQLEDSTTEIKGVLSKEQKLTGPDLQVLRRNTRAAASMSSKTDYFVFRMDIELIDAIRALDETSTQLITKTNRLTSAILGLTVAGVLLALVQLVVLLK